MCRYAVFTLLVGLVVGCSGDGSPTAPSQAAFDEGTAEILIGQLAAGSFNASSAG